MPAAFYPFKPSSFTPTTSGGLPDSPSQGSIKVVGSKKVLPTNYVPEPYPQILADLPILEGSLSWTDTFETEPSGELNFKTWWDKREQVIQLLHVGIPIDIYGIGFRVSDLKFTEIARKQHAKPLIMVQVSLGGKHHWVSNEVPLALHNKKTASSVSAVGGSLGEGKGYAVGSNTTSNLPSGLEKCNGETVGENSSKKSSSILSLGTIASRAGGNYSGIDGKIFVPNDVSPTTTTTFDKELGELLRIKGAFKILWHPDRVTTCQWDNVKTWQFAETDLLKEIPRTFNGELRDQSRHNIKGQFHFAKLGETLPTMVVLNMPLNIVQENLGIYLHAEHYFPRKELTGLFLEKLNKQEEGEKTQLENKSQDKTETWRKRERKIDVIINGKDSEYPPDLGWVKTTSINFYESGSNYVRTKETITTIDGMPYKKKIEKWGFSGLTGAELYGVSLEDFLSGSASDATGLIIRAVKGIEAKRFWKKIEETEETVEYTQEGWRLKCITIGWRLVVHQTENIGQITNETSPMTEFPTLANLPDPTDGDTIRQEKRLRLESYLPKRVPVFIVEENLLTPYNAYYADINLPEPEIREVCSPLGIKSHQLVDNIGDGRFIDPRFVEASQTYRVEFDEIDDPRNPQIRGENKIDTIPRPEYPPLFTGTEEVNYTENKVLTVKTPKGTTRIEPSPYASIQFYNNSDVSSKEDRYLAINKKATAGGVSFSAQLSQETSQVNSGRPPQATKLPSLWEKVERVKNEQISPHQQNPEREKTRYFLETGHTPPQGNRNFGNQLISGSLSYAYAETLDQALTAAKTDFLIRDTKASVQETITVWFSPNVRSGERCIYTCNGEVRKRRVFTAKHEILIKGTVNGKNYISSPGTILSLGAELPTSFNLTKIIEPPTQPKKTQDLPFHLQRATVRDLTSIGQITSPFEWSKMAQFGSRLNTQL